MAHLALLAYPKSLRVSDEYVIKVHSEYCAPSTKQSPCSEFCDELSEGFVVSSAEGIVAFS
jgi:hypothetical protein